VGLSLGIHLRQPDPRFELVRRLLELWRHHLARPAPWRPEIDQQRQIAAPTWRENVAVVNSMGSPVNKGCWQRPQLGCSDSFAVGTRLMDWQCGQTR
jgi:hypothetical protein